uniref:GLOBIN domain-containing protein n=1 Tax=Globodera pallida TaxID=36090 RepID=A0A183BJT0_GLOPA
MNKCLLLLLSSAIILQFGTSTPVNSKKEEKEIETENTAECSSSGHQTGRKNTKKIKNTGGEAKHFLKQVMERFAEKPKVYEDFLDIMDSFGKHRYTADEVHQRVSGLFRNDPDLIRIFNFFMPDKKMDFEDAARYLKRVKDTYTDKPDVYQQFLGLLNDYKNRDLTIVELYKRIHRLFEKEVGLRGDFAYFMPVDRTNEQLLDKLLKKKQQN